MTIPEPVAVVGLACRFPDAPDPAAFWKLLVSGGQAIREIPPNRLSPLGAEGPPRSGYLNEIDAFDCAFFGFSPAACARMDPRQRLMLELTREGLEDGGQRLSDLHGSSTGVFVGAMWQHGGDAPRLEAGELSMIAGRISHHYGFQGPSVTVDTSTSSSLVAVHLACQALRCGDADLALAGGVNLFRSTGEWSALRALGTLSPDGIARPFDIAANGYVRGEGGGLVVLKRLQDAIRDGDRIYCAIAGSAVNHNGETSGLPAPNAPAQQALIERAYRIAGVPSDRIAYVEAHGAGTRAGDYAEWHALAGFVGGRGATLPIGSVKANIGHLEGAAGIAGLIKLALSAQHGAIPPTVGLEQERFAGRVAVATHRLDWPAHAEAAGVTSLGLCGTNCHVVIRRVLRRPAERTTTPPFPFVISAHSEAALRQYAASLIGWAGDWTDKDLPDICYTAAVRRDRQARQHWIRCATIEELVDGLRTLVAGGSPQPVPESLAFPRHAECVSLPPYPWQREALGRPASHCRDTAARVRDLLADVLRLPAGELRGGSRLLELGLDSLAAFDLEARLEKDARAKVEAPTLLGVLTVDDLIRRVEEAGAAENLR